MKKVIPFTKEMPFKTAIAEVTDIEVTHDLKINDNSVLGNLIVNGNYKTTMTSQLEEPFNFEIPVSIEIDDKYDITDSIIKISDFFFEIINESILKINIELEISNVSEKEIRCYEETNNTEKIEQLSFSDNEKINIQKEVEVTKPKEEEKSVSQNKTLDINNIFPSINDETESYKSYYVYLIREGDTIEKILEKYKTTKEDLTNYNNIENIKVGDKLIIPGINE